MAQLLKKLSFDCLDDLYAAIGYGGLTAVKAVGRIRDDLLKYTRGIQNPTRDGNVNPLRTNPDAPNPNRHSVNGVIVEDIDSCMIKFAKCCTPVPGDPIVGFITKGFGVSIHRADCPNAQNRTDPRQAARWVRVRWGPGGESTLYHHLGAGLHHPGWVAPGRSHRHDLCPGPGQGADRPGPARGPQHLYGVFRGEGCGGAQYHSDQAFEYPGCSRRPAGPELTGAPW